VRLAGATVRNTSRSGIDPSAALTRMGEIGMKAATLDPSNRTHFEESSRLLQNPDVSAVDAALGTCGVLDGPWEEHSGVSGGRDVGSSAQGAAAAVRAAQGAAGTVLGGSPAPTNEGAGCRFGGRGGASGTSLMSAYILFGKNNKSMQQSGLDTARILPLVQSASASAVPGSTSGPAGAGSSLGSDATPSSLAVAGGAYD